MIYKLAKGMEVQGSYGPVNNENHDFPHLSVNNSPGNDRILSVPLGKI